MAREYEKAHQVALMNLKRMGLDILTTTGQSYRAAKAKTAKTSSHQTTL